MKLSILQELLSLTEADDDHQRDPRSKTKTRTKPAFDKSAFEPKQYQPLTKANKAAEPEDDEDEPKAPKEIRGVSKDRTATATRNVNLDARSMNHLADLHRNIPDMGADEVESETPTMDLMKIKPTDVPALLQNAMVAAGYLEPDFHLVSNLPGNMSRAILQLGKVLFKSLTTTPTEKITMIANLTGMGPNTGAELNAVAQFAKEGEDLGPGEIDFDRIMPGYKAKVHHFTNQGVRMMMVKDHAGQYIYCWPEHTSLSHSNGAQLGLRRPEPKRLK